jgi:dihydrofolate reductase
MKLITHTQISLDGVVQANGGPVENGKLVLERGGWFRGLSDREALVYIREVYQRADAFLFGRRTYDLFAGYWGAITDPNDPIAGPLNTKPKYVASNTLTEARWDGTTILSGDLAATIRELKANQEGELQVHGSGTLVQWLLANDLVDEIELLVAPVVVGQGKRLFPEIGPDLALDLIDVRTFPKGITLNIYRPAGRPHYPVD